MTRASHNRAALAAASLLFCALAHAAEPRPFFDARLRADDTPTPAVERALEQARLGPTHAAREAAATRLLQAVPSAQVDDHELFGTPKFIRATDRLLTAPAAGTTPQQVVRRFVGDYQGLFEIQPAQLDDPAQRRMSREFVTRHNGMTHLTYQQQINGLDLFGCALRANVSARGELVSIASEMLPAPAGGFAIPAPSLSAIDAIRAAAESLGIKLTVEPQAAPQTGPATADERREYLPTPDFRGDEPIVTRRVLFPRTRSDVRPAWWLVLPEKGIGNTYEMVVDATSGEVVWRWNRLQFATTEPMSFRAYPSDSPGPGSPGTATPTGFQFPLDSTQMFTVNPGDISAINPNGWMDDGVNETQGNNVDGHLDRNADNSPDLPRPTGTSYRVFDYTPDLAQAPTVALNQNSAVTHLFYLCNVYHDKLWMLGFDEPAGNFQTNNFGRGGTGNDRVQADAQDGSGTNNANFNTSGSDGSSARVQMYLFTGPTPDRDGDMDRDIVFHELTHGTSIRLHQGTLTGSQAGGMGEGWGDFIGLCMNSQPGDDPNEVYSTGGYTTNLLWASYTNNYYYGIRRYPYCTDLSKSPLTYADIDSAQLVYPGGVPRNTNLTGSAGEVHNEGEIWCNTLWQVRANLVAVYGYAANDLIMQLVIDGMKLSPANPTMLMARDAIIAADVADNGGVNAAALWTGFAKRGMGPAATSPASGSASGVVESFRLLQFSYPSGLPTQILPGVQTNFPVVVSGLVAAVSPVPGTGELLYSVNGGPYTPVPMVEGAPNNYTATLPALACFDTVNFYVRAATSNSVESDPPAAPTGARTATVYTSVTDFFSDRFETDLGWTVQNVSLTTGAWVRVDPIGTTTGGNQAQPENDSDDAGALCYITGQGAVGGAAGTQDVDGGPTRLISPVFDLSGGGNYQFAYARWMFSSGAGDTMTVEISNNAGASWTPVEVVTGTTTASWVRKSFSVAAFVPPTNQVQLRFSVIDNSPGTIVEGGVDDVHISTVECIPVVSCTRGDVTNNGTIDGEDIVRFVDVLLAGGGTAVENCAGDLGAVPSGAIDVLDIPNFVACLLSGGPC
ncbi:MAG: M36 family metallopeptidase [Phycisphaerae bacterium]